MPGLSNSRWAAGRPTTINPLSYTPREHLYRPQETSFYQDSSETSSLPGTSPATAPRPLTVNPAAPYGKNPLSSGRHENARHELVRYTKIVRRLKWKLPLLEGAYELAVARLGKDTTHVIETEQMFKLDFFEYYMLIERALVHLLGVFGITVSKNGFVTSTPFASQTTPSNRTTNGLSQSGWNTANNGGSSHRYHANVIEALDNPQNPLHKILGKGEVRKALQRAKDLRNRWKTAADEDEYESDRENRGSHADTQRMGPKKVPAPLESYRLPEILKFIFFGFDQAFLVAEGFVLGTNSNMNGDTSSDVVTGSSQNLGSGAVPDINMTDDDRLAEWAASEEDPWDFMVDAMDWEAV